MSATIRIGDVEAQVDAWVWTSEEASLAAMLNAALPPFGPSGGDPNPDLTLAQQVAEALGGKLVRFDSVPSLPGRVY